MSRPLSFTDYSALVAKVNVRMWQFGDKLSPNSGPAEGTHEE